MHKFDLDKANIEFLFCTEAADYYIDVALKNVLVRIKLRLSEFSLRKGRAIEIILEYPFRSNFTLFRELQNSNIISSEILTRVLKNSGS